MTSCGLPDNCCVCFSLKKGGKIIAGICLATSVIACILIIFYLCSNLDEITKEIADNSEEVKHTLNESSGCEFSTIFNFFSSIKKINISFVFSNNKAARFSAVVLLLLSIALLLSSGLLIKGIQSVSDDQL